MPPVNALRGVQGAEQVRDAAAGGLDAIDPSGGMIRRALGLNVNEDSAAYRGANFGSMFGFGIGGIVGAVRKKDRV